ncbi:MAG: DUF3592 domain-containing protein, partial [Propionicimonas sp.]
MATVVLAIIAGAFAVTLLAVLWSTVRALGVGATSARLRRNGVRATGMVVDNALASTPQRRVLFSPVVQFRAHSGQHVHGAAQQASASSWPRGATVEIVYDPADPRQFVLAGRPERGHRIGNVIVGLVIAAILAG